MERGRDITQCKEHLDPPGFGRQGAGKEDHLATHPDGNCHVPPIFSSLDRGACCGYPLPVPTLYAGSVGQTTCPFSSQVFRLEEYHLDMRAWLLTLYLLTLWGHLGREGVHFKCLNEVTNF